MRNHTKLLAILIVLAFGFAFACERNSATSKPPASAERPETRTYTSVGVVKYIDADSGKITLDHEEIPGFMPAMEMTEAVSDARVLEGLRVGDKIEFDIERTETAHFIAKINKIGETVSLNGGEIYKTNCAECHGAAGEGAPKGISLLKGHALKHSEKDFIEMVTHGEEKKMPPFKDVLSPEQITAVVKYIREDLQKDVSKDTNAEHKH